MGYRSDLCLCIKKDKAAELKARYVMGNLPEAGALFENDTGVFDHCGDGGDFLYWTTTSVKWYSHYSEVQTLNKLLEALDMENPNLYGMIRTGEDNNDIEEWGEPQEFDLYVNRSFSIG